MSDAPLMLGVSGLRGIVGESLTPEVAVRYAGAFAWWLREQMDGATPYVLVGRDGRAGGESTYTAAISALLASGCRVLRLGVATTPTVGLLTDLKEADASIMVTASHNPGEWNGLKLLLRKASWMYETDGRLHLDTAEPDACAPNASDAGAIIEAFHAGRVSYLSQLETQESTVELDEVEPHCLRIKDAIEEAFGVGDFDAFVGRAVDRVVVDAVNASGVDIDRAFFEGGSIQVVPLAGGSSGVFPHTPEPTAENLSGEGGLCDAVPGLKADVGFAQDPDADRLAIVDEAGRYIGEEYTLALCALSLLRARAERSRGRDRTDGPVDVSQHMPDPSAQPSPQGEKGAGGRVLVANLSTSRMIDDIAAAYGARVVRTPVGEANVVEAMKRLKAEGHDVVVGGEGNGGVIWPDVVYVRDSIGSMALVLSLMAQTGKRVSELVADIDASTGGEAYAIVKTKRPLARKEDAAPVVEKIASHYRGVAGAEVDTQDGVRVDWPAQKTWVHVRASNTEPIMRLIAEAPGRAEAERRIDEVGAMVG